MCRWRRTLLVFSRALLLLQRWQSQLLSQNARRSRKQLFRQPGEGRRSRQRSETAKPSRAISSTGSTESARAAARRASTSRQLEERPWISWRRFRVNSRGRYLRVLGPPILAVLLSRAPPATAEIPYRVFGVDVYFADPSPCGEPKTETPLAETFGQFQKVTTVAEILMQLAEKASAAGANMVHGVTIVSSKPGEGTHVTAIATDCLSLLTPHLQTLTRTVHASTNAQVYLVAPGEMLPRPHRVADTRLVSVSEVQGEKLAALRSLLPNVGEPQPLELNAPCRFVPSIAISFSDAQIAWWVLSD